MDTPSTEEAVYKLAVAAEQAGFSLEDMIQILNAGVTVETLLRWIERRLGEVSAKPSALLPLVM